MPNILNLKGILWAAGVAFVLGLGSGGWAVRAFYAPRLELAQQRVKDLGDALKIQNDAVKKLGSEGKARAKAAAKELALAQAAAEKAEAEWLLLLQRQKPEGVDVCTAASALITEELAK